jgi:hypothetical protein
MSAGCLSGAVGREMLPIADLHVLEDRDRTASTRRCRPPYRAAVCTGRTRRTCRRSGARPPGTRSATSDSSTPGCSCRSNSITMGLADGVDDAGERKCSRSRPTRGRGPPSRASAAIHLFIREPP